MSDRVPQFEEDVRYWAEKLLGTGWQVSFRPTTTPNLADVEVYTQYKSFIVSYDPSKGTDLSSLVALHEVCHVFFWDLYGMIELLLEEDNSVNHAARNIAEVVHETWTENLARSIMELHDAR